MKLVNSITDDGLIYPLFAWKVTDGFNVMGEQALNEPERMDLPFSRGINVGPLCCHIAVP